MAYVQVTITGYNTNPPPDDGIPGQANKASWGRIKLALFDPIRDAITLIDSNVETATLPLDAGVTALEGSVASVSSDAAGLPTTLKGPTGTSTLFQQTTPPPGWNKNTDLNDYALRLVSGPVGTGGTTAFSSIFTARTIATANLPSHGHSFSDSSPASFSGSNGTTLVFDIAGSQFGAEPGSGQRRRTLNNSNTNISGSFSISGTTSNPAGASGTALDFAVQYVDCIYATRS